MLDCFLSSDDEELLKEEDQTKEITLQDYYRGKMEVS
jgi:hypothetical protein